MNDIEGDGDPTAALDAVPSSTPGDELSLEPKRSVAESGSQVRPRLNDPRQILPVQTYKGASLWRKLVAVLGLGALAITLVVGIIAIVAALVVQAAIS